MKHFFYALVYAMTIVTLPSCCEIDPIGKENQSGELPAKQTIVGSWKVTKYDFTTIQDGEVVGSGTSDAPDHLNWVLTFRADGTMTEINYYEGDDFAMSYGTWIATSKNLYLTYNDDSYILEIVSLTSSMLVVRVTDLSTDGYAEWKDIVDYYFEKQ